MLNEERMKVNCKIWQKKKCLGMKLSSQFKIGVYCNNRMDKKQTNSEI